MIIFGGTGNSTYSLSNGNNWLDTGGGNDFIEAGLGNNTIFGGSGSNTYLFNAGFGNIELQNAHSSDTFQPGSGISFDARGCRGGAGRIQGCQRGRGCGRWCRSGAQGGALGARHLHQGLARLHKQGLVSSIS